MIGMFRKQIGSIISLVLVFLCFVPFSAEAAKKQKKEVRDICFFQMHKVSEKGKDMLRIEIGLTKGNAEYEVKLNPKKSKQIMVELANTRMTDAVMPDITLDGKMARYMTLREKKKTTTVMVAMTMEATEKCYRVYTLPADKKKGLPYRLVIDVSKTPFKAGLGTVDGVKGRTVVIDPGHGGCDSGARGNSGLMEKDVNLMVCLRIRDIMQASGAKCVLTRDDDVDVYGRIAPTDADELQARVNIGEYTPNMDIFVSVHSNAAYNTDANGSQTFYYPKTYFDQLLAEKIQQEIVEIGGLRNRGVSEANFYVLRHTEKPAALVEMAFITNFDEEALLWSDDFQDKMAIGISKGIGQYFIDAGY